MNFIALIGVNESLKKINDTSTQLNLKVEKPFYRNKENWYELVSVNIDNSIFSEQLKLLQEPGSVVGVKGRIETNNGQNQLIAERIQVF